jgi:copper chaperone
MVTFEVNDMTCGHCVSSITTAVRAIDQGAQVTVDLATHRVRIESAESNGTELSDAIREAGYTPVPVDDGAAPAERSAPRSGCCCR